MPKGDKELLNEIKGLKQRYRAFVDDAPDGIIEVGRNGVVLYANRKALKIAGRAKGNFIGKSLASLMPSESVFRELRDLQKVFRGKTLEDYSFEIADKKGKIRGVVANINPVKDGTKITGAQIILRCAPALGTAEAKCAGLLENANDLIQSVNSEGKFIYVNKKWKELLGYSDAEVKKLGLMDIIRKDQRAHCKEMFGKVMRGKTLTAVETVFVGKRGNEVHVEGNVTPHMENGKFVSTMAIFRDVSGRKTAEKNLLESELKFREIFENANDGIAYLDKEGKILDLNPVAIRMFGGTREKLIGKNLMRLGVFPKKDVPKLLRTFNDIARGKLISGMNVKIKNMQGTELSLEAVPYLIKRGGKITGISIILRDITWRRGVEERLKEERDKARKYIDLVGVMVVSLNEKGEATLVNKRAAEILGYREDEIIYQNWFDKFLPKETRETVRNVYRKLMAGKVKVVKYYESPVLTKGGNERKILWHNTVLKDDAGKTIGTLSAGDDMTEREEMERKLEEREERYRKIFELSPEAIVAVNPKGHIVEINKRLTDWLGYKPNDIKGMHMLKLPFIPAKSKAIMIKNFGRRMLGKDFPPYELEFKAKGGKIIVGRIIGTLIKDSKGKKIADLIMISDVTEQAKYEDALRQSKHDLEVAMRRLGKTNKELMHQSNMRQEFINTVVHELKTPLTPVRGYLEMLLGEDLGELNPKQKDALEVISRSINLSKNLIEDLSGLSKAEAVKSKVTKKRTDLLDIINFVAKEMKSFALEKKITLVAELPKSLPVVNADRGQMEQLLTNLIHNAIKFTPEQGFVGVSAARQGKNIVVSIRDTGIGISKADQKKLFTKFFRAKSARDEGEGGTGLGLSICKRIIEVHNGKIGVKSTLGRGTTFTFTIPAMG